MRPLGDHGTGRRVLPFVLLGFALVGAWLSVVVLLGGDGREPATGNGALPAAREGQERTAREVPDPDAGAVRGEPVARPPVPKESSDEGGASFPGMQAPPEGASGEPGGHDPLGLGAEPNESSSTERGRAEAAAFHFVRHAYDLPGDDRAEYLSGVSQAVVSPEFFGSSGGGVISAIADRVADGGVDSPATFESFQMGRESLDRIEGVATFRLGGDRRYEQELGLMRWGATWRVISAGEVREAGR